MIDEDNGLDLLNLIHNSNDFDAEETILDAKEVIKHLKEDEFKKSFIEARDDLAEDTLRCKYCGKELTPIEEDYMYIVHRCMNNECYK